MPAVLSPFPFHVQLRDHFKLRERTWKWFSEQQVKEEQAKAHRTALLKNTYRLDPATYATAYASAAQAVKALNIDAEVTLYQEQNTTQLNAGISILGKEAHIVLSGRLMELLTEKELLALLGHELAHYLFYALDGGEHEITNRVVYAIANDERSEDVHVETARLYSLYMELFCDRGAMLAAQDVEAVLSCLIKLHTGLAQVNTTSYVQQAEEVVTAANEGSEAATHPENYLRCLALHYWHNDPVASTERIERLIRGPLDINNLDLFRQKELQALTQDVLLLAVKPGWIFSTAVGALCRSYFPELKRRPDAYVTDALREQVKNAAKDTRNYLCYVLLDVARCDSEQEEVPMGHMLELAELLGLTTEFDAILRKELKLGARELKQLKDRAMESLSKMKDVGEESLQEE
ncbi:MAG: M48 family metalloprotease [Flavobacteriales bacterium]|nr:M48 family metalloprotease [Flavobacteriales bacterium]